MTGDSGMLLLFCMLMISILVYVVFILIPDCCRWVLKKIKKEEIDIE